MTTLDPATIDPGALRRLRALGVGPGDKGLPRATWGQRLDDVAASGLRVSDLPTPLVTLAGPALAHNVAVLAAWCRDRGLLLAPHGKTTMAPDLWAQQLAAGAVAITVATEHQLWTALEYGVSRVHLANSLARAGALRDLAGRLDAHPDVEVSLWVDSVTGVEVASRAFAGASRPLPVLVELGAADGRTGARGLPAAIRVAEAATASPGLSLRGTAGYEGVVSHGTGPDDLDQVRDYLRVLADLHLALRERGLLEEAPAWCTAGGSAYFDVVTEVLAPLAGDDVVVLRSGVYIAHDDGFSARTSPLGSVPRDPGPQLRPALHAWGRVLSVPEPGLVLVDGGKRDWSFDIDLPVAQQLRRSGTVTELTGVRTEQLNDQHTYLRWPDVAGPGAPRPGDLVRLGLSHPCTTFDRWRSIPVIDDADALDPVVTDVVRTIF